MPVLHKTYFKGLTKLHLIVNNHDNPMLDLVDVEFSDNTNGTTDCRFVVDGVAFTFSITELMAMLKTARENENA